ncbi:MAG: Rrf2 family transcriptional regulator [Bacteroidetes bacterium]|uniref:Rrf2 family transcriptional regulator n=1 Tax=Phaeocystidibacter marisrubri TaxID=1577780 RepID=A0A6L3ZIQ9_9FLAO|nr:Rrf2 family transcriptional regulator [Phaeocystidibacter marisrubri]KAB2817892.1 Rrf2 family transcriptional regulator [Phaeocystidibacter marisrubri]TNE31159.1 MAG: Rrf2 family transcriptional regulator [Bacteroidota bacterium]GGH73009.1 Rrf2 family transcriptional regulator [Phaeocystidibacter marisrubri]
MLSKKSKYAINALVYLAKQEDNRMVVIQEIAEEEKIPRKFLEAILLDLKRNGILGSKQGKGGGYYLLQRPNEINLADVMRLFDGPIALLPCATYKFFERCEECVDVETCGIRDAMVELRNQTVNFLKATSLEDILLREGQLTEGSRETRQPHKSQA